MKNLKWLLILLLVAGFLVGISTTREHVPQPQAGSAGRPAESAATPATTAVKLISVDAVLRPAVPAPSASAMVTQPEAVFEGFKAWAEAYLSSPENGPKPGLLEEGENLARVRRELLAQEIRTNPQAALEHAAPWRWRQGLPPQITAYFEQAVHGRGDLWVLCAFPRTEPGDHKDLRGGTLRYATFGQTTYQAYVYGRRLRQMTKKDVPLHGIAIDRAMALHEDSLRMLEPEEAAVLAKAGKAPLGGPCTICGVRPMSEAARVVELGGQLFSVCSQAHAARLSRTLATAEEKAPLSSTTSIGSSPPPVSPKPTFGPKKVLFMRVVFPDDTIVPITEAEAVDVMNRVNDFYVEASYNKTALITTVAPLLTLPQPKLYYAAQGPFSIYSDAAAAARAAGYDPAAYDLKVIRHPSVPSFDWGGLGGGGIAWLQGNGAGLIAHELGHNYGLPHANYWETRRAALPPNPNNLPFDNDGLVGHDSIIGPGDNVEYGDVFDVMGSGGGESSKTNTQTIGTLYGHFNAIGKHLLGWLPDSYVTLATENRTNRIYAYDAPQLAQGRSYAVVAAKDMERNYWISARSRIPNNRWLDNGLELHWDGWQQNLGYSQLLDTSPGSKPGRDDCPILLGHTFSDPETDLHITPVAKGGTGAELWFDVVVNRGPFANNAPPVLQLDASTNKVSLGGTVTFAAIASDANNDDLAYFWDFGDGSYTNTPAVDKVWSRPGKYVVRCEVSDMRGGLASQHLLVTVAATNVFSISGRVLDPEGNPLGGVLVHNGSLTNNDYADDYQWTYTDSDGSYTLGNLTNGTYSVGAYLHRYVMRPLNFKGNITVADDDANGVEFEATPLLNVTVEKGADADKAAGKAGFFKLTRTGPTNASLRAVFLLGGSASNGVDYAAYKNTVSQTNVTPNPFGPVTTVYKFWYIDFPTGVVSTNVVIAPSTNGATAGDLSAILTLMYPLQSTRIIVTNVAGTALTNTNIVDISGWEVWNKDGQDTWFQSYPDYALTPLAEATVWLKDQPPAKPTVSVLALDSTVTENPHDSGLFLLTRHGRLDQPLEVALQVTGTAQAGQDYEPLPTKVTFAPGEDSVALPVTVLGDAYLEKNETVIVTVASSPAYQIGVNTSTVIIVENDLPWVTMESPDNLALELGLKPATVMVVRAGDMTRDLVVNYLVTGNAVSGRDYRPLPGTVTIPAGQPAAAFSVVPRDNGLKDGGNTVEIFLSDDPGYNIGAPNGVKVFIQDRALPTVNVAATVDPAAEPGTPGEFTVVRAGDLTRELVVSLKMGGTAKPLADYAGAVTKLRFPPNVSLVRVPITPVDDRFREEPETVILEVVPGPEYNVGLTNQATVTINEDDSGLPAVGFDFLASSGPASAKRALIAVSVSANPADNNNVTVDYQVTGGTALRDVDFVGTNGSGRLLFPHGPDTGKNAWTNRTQLITLPLLDNTNATGDRTIVLSLFEPAITFTNDLVTNDVTITNADGSTITTNQVTTNIVGVTTPMNAFFDAYKSHTFTIFHDEGSVISIESTDPLAKEEDSKPGLFTIKRTVPTNKAQVVYFTLSGSAVNGDDYQPLPDSVTIPAGAYSVTLPLVPVDDPVPEFAETVTVTLQSAPNATIGKANQATVTIFDNDGVIEFARTTYSASEGGGVALLSLHRGGNTNGISTVSYLLTPLSAKPDIDYVVTNGTVTFQPGEEFQNLPVTVLDNQMVDSNRTVLVTLRNAAGAVPLGGQNTAVLTIVDDDTGIEFAASDYPANENDTNGLVRVYRYGVITNRVQADLYVSDGSAVAGVDYVGTNLTVSFDPGVTNVVAKVRLLDNTVLQTNRTALLLLTNATAGAVLGPRTNATLTIVDDECVVQFAAPATYRLQEYGRSVRISVERSGGTANTVSVDYATVDGTALAGKNYVAAAGTLMFTGDTSLPLPDGTLQVVPGETIRFIDIRILDDDIGEGDQSFNVVLRNPLAQRAPAGSAALGASTNAVITIIDNETPGKVDFGFDPGEGADAPVWAVAVQVDGKVPLGGAFNTVDGVILPHVARLHETGYLDSSFNPGLGVNGPVYALTLQPDGRVLIGGVFTQVNGTNINRIARLNTDASLDDNFNPGSGADGAVRAIATQPDGGVVLGGEFATVGGLPRNGVARVNADGSLDSTFDPGSRLTGTVLAVAAQDDGKVVVGGSFSTTAGGNRGNLARLAPDGSLDSSFLSAGGPDGAVRAIALQPDGRLIVAGEFSAIGGVLRGRVARLNSDGSVDTGFDPGAGADDVVNALALARDGKVLLGGSFTNVNGLDRARLARLNPNGSVDPSFEVGAGANDTVRALAIQPDSAVIVGGDFTLFDGLKRSRIARIHGDEKFTLNTLQFSAADYRVSETNNQATIKVLRAGDLQSAVSVDYATADASAKSGFNYQQTNGTLRFASGETEKTFTVPVLDDNVALGDVTVALLLTNLPPSYSLNARLRATLTIEDKESAVAFSAAGFSAKESSGQAIITVRCTGPTVGVVTVDYLTRDGTATNGLDYTVVGGTLRFGAGESEKTFTVPILNDTLAESDKTVLLSLTNLTGSAVLGGQAAAVLTILDDDRVPFYALNITPPVGGTVTPPSGPYPTGSSQTLAATPDPDFVFDGWEGTTNSTANPLTVVMDRNYALTARFRPTTYTYTFERPFAATNLLALPWFSPAGAPWDIQSANTPSGRFALRSRLIGDGQETTIGLSLDTKAGAISFDFRVSSEAGFDFLEFYVNGLRVNRWSGELPWGSFQYPVAQTHNTFVWRYVKDNNYSSGLDAAFVDNIYLPLDKPDTTPAAAQLSLVRPLGGGTQVQLKGKLGLTYVIQASGNLTNWAGFATNRLTTSPIFVTDPQAANYPMRFYRAVTP